MKEIKKQKRLNLRVYLDGVDAQKGAHLSAGIVMNNRKIVDGELVQLITPSIPILKQRYLHCSCEIISTYYWKTKLRLST